MGCAIPKDLLCRPTPIDSPTRNKFVDIHSGHLVEIVGGRFLGLETRKKIGLFNLEQTIERSKTLPYNLAIFRGETAADRASRLAH